MHHKRVPVGSSIAHAYVFLLQNLTNVIGTAWLPALIYGTGFFLFLQHSHDWMPAERQDLASIVLSSCTAILAVAFTLIIRAVIGISLTQEALGVRKDFTLAHFVIGPRELRLFFAYVRFYILAALLYVGVIAVSVGAMYVAQHYGAALAPNIRPGGFPLAVLGAVLVSMVLFVWYLLEMLRLFFLLAAVASAEHHAKLARAWDITRHSAFRVLGVYIGMFLPLALASAVSLYFLVGPDQWAGVIMALQAQKAGAPSALGPFYAQHAFIFASAVGVLSLVGGALFAGAAAHAYREVTGHALPELEDDAALVAPLLEPETPVVVPAPVPVAEELPAPVHHDHNHGDHGLADEEPRHADHHHNGNGHGSNGHGHDARARRDDDDREDDVRDDRHHSHGNDHHESNGHHHGDGHHHHRHDDRDAA
jgi:hypothetical protein